MTDKPIDLAKYARATPLAISTVVWQIMQEDLTKAEAFLSDLYRRGYKIVKLEDGE